MVPSSKRKIEQLSRNSYFVGRNVSIAREILKNNYAGIKNKVVGCPLLFYSNNYTHFSNEDMGGITFLSAGTVQNYTIFRQSH